MTRDLRHDVRTLQRRVEMMLTRGTVKTVNDALKLQYLDLDLMDDEAPTTVEHFQRYGFSANPLPGAEILMGSIHGNRDHGIVLGIDDRRHRLRNLAGGEVSLYAHEGQKIVLKNGQIIRLETGASSIEMTPSGITLTAPRIDMVES